MRYFVNSENMNKYKTINNKIAEMFLAKGYLEIPKEAFEKLKDIF